VYFHSEIPNENDNFKLPASLYSNSIIIGNQFFNLHSIIEFKSFLSQLYTEKNYGILGNIFIIKTFNNGIGIESSIKNTGIIKGDIKTQKLPMQITLNLHKIFNSLPLTIGSGIEYSENEYESYTYFNFNSSFLEILNSVSYSREQDIKYSGGIFFKYENYSIGYSLSSPMFESVTFPQIISLRYNY